MSSDIGARRASIASQIFAADKTDATVGESVSDSSEGLEQPPLPRSKFARIYRSTLFNVFIAGLILFTQPGIWNALNNTGAGGQQEPYLVNGANSLTFGLMVPGCLIFSALATRFGLKKILIAGTLGYAPYAASLYTNNRYGIECFVLFGASLCGISASALWASESAIAVGYPLVHERGMYTGIWLGLRQLGQIIGASIQLSLNGGDDQLPWTSARLPQLAATQGHQIGWNNPNSAEPVSLDWALPSFGRGSAVNCLFMFMNEFHYIFVYWLVGTFDSDVETVTLSVGIVRCFKSVGSALAFGIGAARVDPMVNLVIAFVAFAVCIVPTYLVTLMVPEHPRDQTKNIAKATPTNGDT